MYQIDTRSYSCGINLCRDETAPEEGGGDVINLLYKRAFACGRMRNFTKAEADVQAVLEMDGSNWQALRQSITFLMELGLYEKAVARS